MDKVMVFFAGLAGVIFTYWFFLMKKENVIETSGSADIVVDGGYSPDTISVPVNAPTTITFLRKDPNTCLEEVVLSDFKIRKYLPLNEKVTVTITPHKKGTYQFSCGMNMYHGKIIVK